MKQSIPVANAAKKQEQMYAKIAIIVPTLGFIAAIWWSANYGFSWVDLALLVGMFSLTNLGITAGFHRFFAHHSYKTTKPVQVLLAIAGSMALQGPVLFWSAIHRKHHQYSDSFEDPHSPYKHGEGIEGRLKGWWHSHVGWMFDRDSENWIRYVPDLLKDKLIFKMSYWYFYWVLLGLLIPAILGGLLTTTWQGMISGLLWGGFARIFLLHHTTWSVNSIGHIYGFQQYETKDESKNNLILGLLGFGGGWHNNHHAFPLSARHGLKWWQLDIAYLFISLLQKIGLVWDVNLPTQKMLETKVKKGASQL